MGKGVGLLVAWMLVVLVQVVVLLRVAVHVDVQVDAGSRSRSGRHPLLNPNGNVRNKPGVLKSSRPGNVGDQGAPVQFRG